MRVLTCLVVLHDYPFVLLAAAMCAIGSMVTIHLFRRAISTHRLARNGWLFLTAVCAGSAIWATHFIAMLGYRPAAPVTFDPVLTLFSVFIAIIGCGVGFAIAALSARSFATILGGGVVGLAISSMHYTGMFAYRVEGLVSWHPGYLVASVLLAVVLSILAVGAVRRFAEGKRRHLAVGLLVAAIVALHFTAMAAFEVTPLAGLDDSVSRTAVQAMALSVLLVGLLIVGTGISSYLIDDRNRATSNAQLRAMAFEDALTGLANRRALQRRLAGDIEAGRAFGLLLIDLDHFKRVNDTFGHAVGDEVLVEVARRVLEATGQENFAARMGGDELAAIVYADETVTEAVANAIVDAANQPIEIDGHSLLIGCSVGSCSIAEAGTAEDLMRQADIALYEAKRLGRKRAFRYRPGMLEIVSARHRLEADMKGAIGEGQFHLVYQPLVDLRTEATIGYEALIRWSHPERGLIAPADFIPVAEESGAIVAIGRWVLQEACREAANWDPAVHVAVNVSAVQFRSAAFLNDVTQALAASGLPARRLEVELTETAIVTDGAMVAHTLAALQTLGVRIAMDDFGTGYSSLAHLRDLPLDRIKIDRSFVASAHEDPNSMAVLRAITSLGRDMGIATLGEGVETNEQMQLLQELGCDAVQGYLTGRPQRFAARPASIASTAARAAPSAAASLERTTISA